VPNAIDTSRFQLTTAAQKAEARQALALPSKSPVLLHFGWDWRRKGGDAFVRTIGALIRGGTEVLGVSVGAGEPGLETVLSQGLVERVRVLPTTNDVRTLYAAADVFMTPSKAEGMPFSMAEALCTGLAVVGSRIPGQTVIAQNITACRLTQLDCESLAQAIRSTLSRAPQTVADESLAARAEIVRRLDLVPWAQRMMDRFLESITRKESIRCASSNRF
jgi:glycosyltransferase involved in cell wall biosynthesis